MNVAVVGCKTIQRELEKAMRETGRRYPVSWIESGLHNFPDKLRSTIQEIFDSIDADRILLAMGFCGNSLAGLETRGFEVVFPRADDCITILIGSFNERKSYEKTYFLTKGWLEGERNIYEEYKYAMNKYGAELGRTIVDMMLEHYEYLGILDTGAYEYEALIAESKPIAESLGLDIKEIPATDSFLKQLLTGPWPEDRFKTVPARSKVEASDLSVS
jgi:hypothetical protein